MATYLYLLRLVRPVAFESPTVAEEEAIGAHFAHLRALLAAGTLILAGPCLDGAFGLVVFEADGDEAAEQLMASDPAVVAGVMTAEVHPFRVSLWQAEYCTPAEYTP